VLFAGEAAALTGLAALETVADFEVFLTEGKTQSYLALRTQSFRAHTRKANHGLTRICTDQPAAPNAAGQQL
jgi:hypothetical protein